MTSHEEIKVNNCICGASPQLEIQMWINPMMPEQALIFRLVCNRPHMENEFDIIVAQANLLIECNKNSLKEPRTLSTNDIDFLDRLPLVIQKLKTYWNMQKKENSNARS